MEEQADHLTDLIEEKPTQKGAIFYTIIGLMFLQLLIGLVLYLINKEVNIISFFSASLNYFSSKAFFIVFLVLFFVQRKSGWMLQVLVNVSLIVSSANSLKGLSINSLYDFNSYSTAFLLQIIFTFITCSIILALIFTKSILELFSISKNTMIYTIIVVAALNVLRFIWLS